MSLNTIIEPLDSSHSEIQRILENIQPAKLLGVGLSPEKQFFGLFKRKPLICLVGMNGLLTDQADWNAEFWEFELEGAKELANFLFKFSEAFKNDFIFASIWAGDEKSFKTQHLTLSADRLVEAARENRIGTKTFYKVVSSQHKLD